ncbi:N-acetylneuraminate (7)9-O-acetyltransferase [Dermatophagoides pteronyssinus]|uniref:N-acetylneuraminate 9-O-acetyltransferase-like n=1 Tax=Dermatophagoides pteronyssinus TaxID=6956 RepID=A0A6P6XTT4_DERPT|nr:N-acetylneuraminate 9-O-acetyltransferase-like [Dermatophagoides pteronyssinus]
MKSEIFTYGFSDHWMIRNLLSSNNIKKVAFLLTFVLIGYHGVLHLTSGVKSCKWLLSDGSFHGFGSYRVWQPYGCMLHTYTKIDTRMCLKYIAYWGGRNHIVFMGDARIHQLYEQFVQSIDVNPPPTSTTIDHHYEDSQYQDKDLDLNIRFLWRPVVNRSMIDQCKHWSSLRDHLKPNIVIMGSATDSIRSSNGSAEALEFYHKNLTIMLPCMESLNRTTRFLWVLQDPIKQQHYGFLQTEKPKTTIITNEQIDLYNKAAMEALRFARANTVHVWSSARLVAQGFIGEDSINGSNDELRIDSHSLKFSIQILLNLYCNDHMNYNDGTCCSDPEKITAIQFIVLMVFTMIIAISTTIYIYNGYFSKQNHFRLRRRKYKWTRLKNDDCEFELIKVNGVFDNNNSEINSDVDHDDNDQDHNNNSNEVPIITNPEQSSDEKNEPIIKRDLFFLLTRLGIIMLYFYLCDRTNFFMKENKYFTRPNFLLPIAYVFALGLFFTDESSHTNVLHTDQTNEIKGWMQLVILAYHYTGASQVLPIYMSVRLLVSLYLFLSGYGHFTYFYTTGDVSFTRFWKVIFRLNFLAVCLCLCMNRPYQFYYFVPLVTFWFIIMFTTFKIIPHVSAQSAESNSSHYFYLVLKLVTLFAIVSLLYTSEVFFENIFLIRPWKALFVNADDSIKEWWFRWKIDRYSVLFGMITAFGLQMLRKHQLIWENDTYPYLFPFRISIFAIFSALIGLIFYIALTFLCNNKSECNELHPYVSFIPIISFIILRNTSKWFRSRFSLLFSWFGRISLELFLCQYHIWLAADTHGILVLIPGYPVLNVVITSFIFISIAHDIHMITDCIVHCLITNDWRYTLRNLCIICLILLPVGIKDGMF